MTTREALEAALVADPDDVVRHAAYADYLIEQGDPRGEYIRLQLAAEDRTQSVANLRELEDAAHKLLLVHEREWLGGLWPSVARRPSARLVAGPIQPSLTMTWRRGWIDGIRVHPLSDELVNAIASAPITRLLGTFAVTQQCDPSADADEDRYPVLVELRPLLTAGRFANVRHFEIGSADGRLVLASGQIFDALRAMRRLESLRLCVDEFFETDLFCGRYPRLHTIDMTYNNPRCRFYLLGDNDGLPNLRRLSLEQVADMPARGRLRPGHDPITPSNLQMFFRTQHLTALEHLTSRNRDFGDAGVAELLASGFVTRLKGLDLCRCNITDDGAQLLAAHPHVPRLEYLHLDGNLLSPVGLDALEAVGVRVNRRQYFGYNMGADDADPDPT
jgi:uncharacterized protein (TIGR02996 family)